MTRRNFAKLLGQKTDLTIDEARDYMEAFADTLAEILVKGDKLIIENFATFETKEYKASYGRNPQTNELFKKPPHKRLICRFSNSLKDRVNGK